MTSLWIALAVRALFTAGIVVAASIAVERSGPFIGAMIATLPLSAGPAYLFLALDHDAAFLAESAIASLLSVAATCVFMIVYTGLARRTRTWLSLGASLLGWAATIAVLSLRNWSLPDALLVFVLLCLAGIWATRDLRRAHVPAIARTRPRDVMVRSLAVAALVVGVTVIGRLIGPKAAGLAALAPVVFTSLVLIMQPRSGGAASAAIMAHGLIGMLGFGIAFALLDLSATRLGSGTALALALAACLSWNGSVVVIGRSLARRRAVRDQR